MGTYRFAYFETNVGYIEVEADNAEEALEKANNLDGSVDINKSETSIGELIESF